MWHLASLIGWRTRVRVRVPLPTSTGGHIQKQIRKNGKLVWVNVAEFDPNPMFCPDRAGWFDPRYGPDTQEQIDYHVERGTPGADTWEVGEPAKPYD